MNDGLYKICNICLTMSYVKSSSMDNETFVLISSSQCLYNVYGNLLASAVIRKKENKSIRMEYILENVFLLKILLDQDGFKDTQTSICNGHAMVHPHMLWMINHSFVTLFTQQNKYMPLLRTYLIYHFHGLVFKNSRRIFVYKCNEQKCN